MWTKVTPRLLELARCIDTWDHTPPPLAKMLTGFLSTPGVTHSWCSRWTWLSQTCCPEHSHQRKSVHFHNPANLEAVEAGLSPHYNCWQQLYKAISEQDVLILKQDQILGGKLHKGEAELLPNSWELMRGQLFSALIGQRRTCAQSWHGILRNGNVNHISN